MPVILIKMLTLNPNVWAQNVQTHSRDNVRLWCEWAKESIYGVDQYESVDLIEWN